MATGAGLGSLIPVALSLVGIVAILRARASRRASRLAGRAPADDDLEKRQLAAAETERRMASYLAGRDTSGRYGADTDQDEQESRR
jgi:hypothetical protein